MTKPKTLAIQAPKPLIDSNAIYHLQYLPYGSAIVTDDQYEQFDLVTYDGSVPAVKKARGAVAVAKVLMISMQAWSGGMNSNYARAYFRAAPYGVPVHKIPDDAQIVFTFSGVIDAADIGQKFRLAEDATAKCLVIVDEAPNTGTGVVVIDGLWNDSQLGDTNAQVVCRILDGSRG